MKIFEGRYSWDGTKSDGKDPISWFPGAYDISIVDIEAEQEKVSYLRPIVCVFSNTGQGNSVYAHPERLAERICEDFTLRMEKVLWVERLEPSEEKFEVIVFSIKGRLGSKIFYETERRNPSKGEMQIIEMATR